MVNTRRKGYRTMMKAIAILQQRGWEAETVEKTGKFLKRKDLFGLFDIIAIRPGFILLINTKTNKIPALKAFSEFQKKHWHITVEVWVWKDREGFSEINLKHYNKGQQ